MDITHPDLAIKRLREKADQLATLQTQVLSEADTRVKIIDVIFRDVLLWDINSIKREEHTKGIDSSGFIDYEFNSQHNEFIVEAKRTGVYFEIPNTKTRVFNSRTGVLSHAASLDLAIRQVLEYCKTKGARIGVVSNGLQFAIVYAHSDVNFDTVVFDGIEDIIVRFNDFWCLLSPDTNALAHIKQMVAMPVDLRPKPQWSKRILETYPFPDETISRNSIDEHIRPILIRYFGDITTDDSGDLLRECYCDSDRQAQYGRQLERLLEDRIPRFDRPIDTITTGKRSGGKFESQFEKIAASGDSGAALLITGGVGVGKTTFLKRFYQFVLNERLKEKVLWLYIDFERLADPTGDVNSFVDEEILGQLRNEKNAYMKLEEWETLNVVYESEITRQRKGVWKPYYENDKAEFDKLVANLLADKSKNTHAFIADIIHYARVKLGKTPCIVLDNSDIYGQNIQEQVVHLAFQKAKTLQAITLISIRQETYWSLQNSKPFDAYPVQAYHIAAPKVANVLALRLKYLRDVIGDKSVVIETSSGKHITNVRLADFFEIIVQSFLSEHQENILALECLAANNIRRALDMFNMFLTSGHTNTDEYLSTYIKEGRYLVPNHALIRSLALGERKYYDSNHSLIVNLFAIEDDGFYSHFTKIRLLAYLHSQQNVESGSHGRGYVKISELFDALQFAFRDERALLRSLGTLLAESLLVADTSAKDVSKQDINAVRLTAAGHYYLTQLMYQFEYLEQMIMDTPICSPTFFASLEKDTEIIAGLGGRVERLEARLLRAKHFVEYLHSCEEEEMGIVGIDVNSAIEKEYVSDEIADRLVDDTERILKRAKRSV